MGRIGDDEGAKSVARLVDDILGAVTDWKVSSKVRTG